MMLALSKASLVAVLGLQGLAFLAFCLTAWLRRSPSEKLTGRLIRGVYALTFSSSLLAGLSLLASGQSAARIHLGDLVATREYQFNFILHLDGLSLPFLLLCTLLCGVVAVFSEKYLHREPGFHRYFLLLCLFGFGDCLTVLAGSIETLYFAWELIGLASALLIGFFHERPGPVNNGFYVFTVYRISDFGLMMAAITLFSVFGTGDFHTALGSSLWPHGDSNLARGTATLVGFCVLLAAMGKSAQVPFSNWLPRAMEGPTPSTAIFYGALSVHAGAYLLLRFSPLWQDAPAVSACIFGIGLVTAVRANLVGRVQTDVKCRLAYATLTQVGIIFAEIGLGFRLLPVVHCLGHAVLRSVQYLRSPSLLHEIHELRSTLGEQAIRRQQALSPAHYQAAFHGYYLEALLQRIVLEPLHRLCDALTRIDQTIVRILGGAPRN